MIDISDEDLLKKENITIENSIKEFDKLALKVNNLKNVIEKEINEINITYDNTNRKLTESFV